MAGQRSVVERRRPGAPLFWLLVLLTLLASSVPGAGAVGAASGAPTTVRVPLPPAGAADHDTPPADTVLSRQHRVLRAAENPAPVGGRSAEGDADECPGDVETVHPEPSMPPLLGRAAPRDTPNVAPPATRVAGAGWAGGDTPPGSVHRCDPDGRGPPARL